MIETERLRMRTPAKQWIDVDVLEPDHVVKTDEYGQEWVCPLLDDESGIRALATYVKEPIIKKRNCPILFTGDPGIGKSTAILKTAIKVDPSFDETKVAFPLEEFEDIFFENPDGNAEAGIFPQVDVDEAAHAMYGPEYLELEQRLIVKNLTITRIKKQIVYFATPRWKLLNPHVRNLITMWVHISEPDYYHPGYAVVKLPPPKLQNEYAPQKFWVADFAFVFKRLSGPFWDRYEAKKVDFVKEAGENTGKGQGLLRQVALKLHDRGLTETEIGEIIGRHQSRVSRYLSST